MLYIDAATDALLITRILSLLPKQYYKTVSKTVLQVSPLTAYNLKADKVETPVILPSDIGEDEEGMFPYRGLLISSAGFRDPTNVNIVDRQNPDADVIDKIMRVLFYVYMGDSRNMYLMITELSQELKNVIQENTQEVRRQPVQTTTITPWSL
jgi:hypothetical protein